MPGGARSSIYSDQNERGGIARSHPAHSKTGYSYTAGPKREEAHSQKNNHVERKDREACFPHADGWRGRRSLAALLWSLGSALVDPDVEIFFDL